MTAVLSAMPADKVRNDAMDSAVYRELKEESARKDVFLATLAHELRNPLAPIRNAVELMKANVGTPLPLHFQRARDMIERQVDHMTRLVEDLLDVTSITQGKIKLRTAPVDIRDVVGTAVETTRPLFDARNLTLHSDLGDTGVAVDGDATRLRQIVANLLNNAAKYTPGGGRVWVSVKAAGGRVRIVVRDTGIGIAPEMTDKVFRLFVQSDRAEGRYEGGLGIGLALVQKLTELHGGKVWVSSPGPGGGSTFTVEFPVGGPPGDLDAGTAIDDPDLPSGGKCILIVDDNRDAADSLAALLRAGGHRAFVHYDGRGAAEAASLHRPDLVLLDLGLPGVSGLEVCRGIRSRGCRAVVAALTGYCSDETRRQTLEAGFDHHLVKPVDYGELNRIVTTLPVQ